MEILLNAVWAVVAAVSFGTWLHGRGVREHGASLRLQVLALTCALAFLFPVISATDDLHAAQLAVETSDASRKVLQSAFAPRTAAPSWIPVLPAILLLAVLLIARQKFVASAAEGAAGMPASVVCHAWDGRAPPRLF